MRETQGLKEAMKMAFKLTIELRSEKGKKTVDYIKKLYQIQIQVKIKNVQFRIQESVQMKTEGKGQDLKIEDQRKSRKKQKMMSKEQRRRQIRRRTL